MPYTSAVHPTLYCCKLLLLLILLTFETSAAAISLLQNCGGSGGSGAAADTYAAGEPVALLLCRSGAANAGPYLGTVSFTSDDPTVIVPPPYTFNVNDNRATTVSFGTFWTASHSFAPQVLFTAPGRRALNVSFTANAGAAALSQTFTAVVVPPLSVPTLQQGVSVILSFLVALLGACGLTMRSRGTRRGRASTSHRLWRRAP